MAIGTVGATAAIASAEHHATERRLRRLPLTTGDLLFHLASLEVR
ncbi:hypothetical protein ACVCAH_36150 [Micromonospora sp. LZ34]